MKDAANLLGLSYANLYAKYHEKFGPMNAKRFKHLVPYIPLRATSKKQVKDPESFSLDSLNIIEYNEYTGTREEFWGEHFVGVLMNVSRQYYRVTHHISDCILFTRIWEIHRVAYHANSAQFAATPA